MATSKRTGYYSPPLDRFLVKALYYEAKRRGVPMTRLADEIVTDALKGCEGWRSAETAIRTSPEPP